MYVNLACNKKNIKCDFYITALPKIYIYNAYQSHFPIFYRFNLTAFKLGRGKIVRNSVFCVIYAPYPAHRRLRIPLESYVCTTDICVVCSRIDKFIVGSHNSYTSFDFAGEFLLSS